jgi:3-hydroxyisobutyrate dehydrogenase
MHSAEAGPRVAMVGLGRIGTVFVKRLAAAGMTAVVYNRTRAKAEPLVAAYGCDIVDTPAEAAQRCDVIFTALTDIQAVRAVYDGPNGLLFAARPGHVFIEASTVAPAAVQELARDVGESGAEFLDVTITGSPAEIDGGHGFVLVGGGEAAVGQVQPYLDAVGSVHHVGPAGSSTTMKLAVNSMFFAYLCAAAEALGIAERSGINRQTAYEVLAASPLSCAVLEGRGPSFIEPGSAEVQAPMNLANKDLRTITDMARMVGAPAPMAERVSAVFEMAAELGFAERDTTAGICEFIGSDSARAISEWPISFADTAS